MAENTWLKTIGLSQWFLEALYTVHFRLGGFRKSSWHFAKVWKWRRNDEWLVTQQKSEKCQSPKTVGVVGSKGSGCSGRGPDVFGLVPLLSTTAPAEPKMRSLDKDKTAKAKLQNVWRSNQITDPRWHRLNNVLYYPSGICVFFFSSLLLLLFLLPLSEEKPVFSHTCSQCVLSRAFWLVKNKLFLKNRIDNRPEVWAGFNKTVNLV